MDKATTLTELNVSLDLWINEYYHKNPHSALDGLSLGEAFRQDKRSLTFVAAGDLAEVFLHTTSRRVDKVGCISFKSKKYEIGTHLLGRDVEVFYDPTGTDEVEIHHKDLKPSESKLQIIGENCTKKLLDESFQAITANGSRLLSALNKDNISNRPNSCLMLSLK